MEFYIQNKETSLYLFLERLRSGIMQIWMKNKILDTDQLWKVVKLYFPIYQFVGINKYDKHVKAAIKAKDLWNSLLSNIVKNVKISQD